MRIALLSHLASSQAPTGAEHSLVLLARGLAERDHQVTVAAPGPWALRAPLGEAGIELATIGHRCCWLTSPTPQPLPLQVLRALRYALPGGGRRQLKHWLREQRPDVVHVNCLPHLHGAAAARAAGAPLVWHLREILPAGARRRWFARRLARDADRIVAVSDAVAAWLRHEGLGDRVEVVYNGVRPAGQLPTQRQARIDLELPEDGCLVALLSQIIAHKGTVELLRSARLALSRQPDLRFLIAGSGGGSYLRKVEAEIRGGPWSERIHLLPPQPGAGRLLAAADVVVMTTLSPDPLPRVVLEAMAACRPVVAFAGGGVPEMVLDGETGYLVRTGDLHGLSERLVQLAGDSELRQRLGAAGRKRAADCFSLERHIDGMERVLANAGTTG